MLDIETGVQPIRNPYLVERQRSAQAPLIAKANDLRKQRGMSIIELCQQIGISKALWVFHQNGTYPVRFDTLAGLARVFPEMKDDIYEYLTHAPLRPSFKYKQRGIKGAVGAAPPEPQPVTLPLPFIGEHNEREEAIRTNT